MRPALWLFVAGCWRFTPAPPPEAAAPTPAVCDPPRWRELASTTRRAWLVSLDEPHAHRPGAPERGAWRHPSEPVALLAIEGGDVRVATIDETAIVARWVAVTGLGRAATAGAAVSPSPGAAPDPAVRIRRGYRLPDGPEPWLSVKHAPAEIDGLDLEGFVPARLRGFAWDEPPPAPASTQHAHREDIILGAPQAGAPARAKVTRDAELEVRGMQSSFWEVTARTRRAEVDGFIPAPQPPPPRQIQRGVYDFSDDIIEGDRPPPPSPLPPDTCLHDSPGGAIAGLLLGPHPTDPRPVRGAPGWSAIDLETVWGTVTYYIAAPR